MERKKVIFLNTHISDFVNQPESFCESLRFLFEVFQKEKRAILLWRPHPLTLETMKVRNLEIYNDYKSLVDEFSQMKNGIYDQTADYHMAFSLSDGYIAGLGSSLTELYRLLKKPMFTYFSIGEVLKTQFSLAFIAGATVDETIYFSSCYFNGFFKLNIITKELVQLGIFKDEKISCFIHRKACFDGENIWFVPQRGYYITKVNLNDMSIKNLEIPDSCKIINSECKVSDIIINEGFLWVIPAGMDSLLRIDIETNKIESFSLSIYLKIENDNALFFSSGIIVERNIWLCPYDATSIVSINIDTMEVQTYKWGQKKRFYSGIAYDGKFLWFSPQKAKAILKFRLETKTMEQLKWCEDWELYEDNFSNIEYYRGKILLIPYQQDYVLSIDTATYEIQRLQYNKTAIFASEDSQQAIFHNVIETSQLLIILSHAAQKLVSISKESLDTIEILADLSLSETAFRDYSKKSRSCVDNYEEIEYHGLNTSLFCFLDNVCSEEINIKTNSNDSFKEYGEQIWNYIRKQLELQKDRSI